MRDAAQRGHHHDRHRHHLGRGGVGRRDRCRRAWRRRARRRAGTAALSTRVASPPTQPLTSCCARPTVGLDVPVIAAGGLMTAVDVADVLASGAVAASLGTAFLLADEAGSSPVHRGALQDPQFAETVVTRCFSGRYARGLRNRFIEDHDGAAPFGYPEIHYMTSPLRAAAVRAGDPHGTNVWAGTGFQEGKGRVGRGHHLPTWPSGRLLQLVDRDVAVDRACGDDRRGRVPVGGLRHPHDGRAVLVAGARIDQVGAGCGQRDLRRRRRGWSRRGCAARRPVKSTGCHRRRWWR